MENLKIVSAGPDHLMLTLQETSKKRIAHAGGTAIRHNVVVEPTQANDNENTDGSSPETTSN